MNIQETVVKLIGGFLRLEKHPNFNIAITTEELVEMRDWINEVNTKKDPSNIPKIQEKLDEFILRCNNTGRC